MEELYINDILIDLHDNSVALTKQINDIGDIKDRNAHYSNNIRIPKTLKNIKTLGLLGVFGNTSTAPYVSLSVKYVLDGIELISSGKGIVKNTNDYFNLVIYDGNISLSETLTTKQIKTLTWTAHNHTLTIANYIASFANISGYIYSFADYYDGATIINIDRQCPSIFVHTLWDMIFTQNGLTYSGTIFSDVDFKSRIITASKGYNNTIINGTITNKLTTSYAALISRLSATDSPETDTVGSGTIASNGNYTFTIGNVSVTPSTPDDTETIDFVFLINGTEIYRERLYTFTGSFSFTIVSKIIEAYLKTGDTFTVNFETKRQPAGISVHYNYNVNSFILDLVLRSIAIDFSTIFNDETQISFVKDIMQHYGLMVNKINNSNNYEFVKIDTLVTDKSNAINWSGKFVDTKNEIYKSNYGQVNYARYSYDDIGNNQAQIFANGTLLVSNINIQNENDLFTSPYKASNFADGSVKYRKIKMWELDQDNVIVPLLNGIHIGKNIIENRSITYGFSDQSYKTTEILNIPYFDVVTYQTELNNNYISFGNVLNNYHKLTVLMNLNLIDIIDLNFLKLVYIEQLGKYFYLNKITNFRKNKTTDVELIEV